MAFGFGLRENCHEWEGEPVRQLLLKNLVETAVARARVVTMT